MSLSNGREYLAIPGPSVMPDRVLRAMHRASPNIYEGALPEMVAGLVPDLKAVARTKHHVAIYIANGHAVWEAALSNIVAEGDKVLVMANGRFGHGWAEMAAGLGCEVEILDFGRSGPVDPEALAAPLQADKGQRIKAVLVCHTDTASTATNDIAAIRQVIDRVGHPALFAVDCIASLGCDRFEMDVWGVDVMISASQKGLMTPPGLGFVFFNDKAAQVRAAMLRVSRYWDWVPRSAPEMFYQYWSGTAPTHHLYGLREALDMIAEEGLEAIWTRHETLARTIWAVVDVWGQDGPLRLNVAEAAYRSHAVTSLRIGAPNGARLRHWTERHTGVTLGIGLGMESAEDPHSSGYFRIGHMGHVNAHMVLGVLGAIDAGMKALKIPHGRGALDAATEVIAGA
jgi:alanine-glyoxylate transaminase/serine-glyoxylate transaminase/serine-pyruvate transaminase